MGNDAYCDSWLRKARIASGECPGSKGHKITIVDAEETKFKNLEEHENIQRVGGNILNEETADLVFAEPVDVFIAVTGSDNINLMVSQAMQKKYKIPKVLIRVFDPTLSSVYRDLGLETVCPTNFALQEMLKMLEKGSNRCTSLSSAGKGRI